MTTLRQYRNGLSVSGVYLDVQWGGEVDGDVPKWSAAAGKYVPSTSGASPTGAAGGDLAGTYPNPTLATTQAPAITWSALQTFSLGISVASGESISGAGALTLDCAAGLTLGGTNATSISIGRSGITTEIVGGLTQQTGACSLTGNAASQFVTTAGALTFTAAAASTWSTSAGLLTVTGADGLTLSTGGTTDITLTPARAVVQNGGTNVPETIINTATSTPDGTKTKYLITVQCTVTLNSALPVGTELEFTDGTHAATTSAHTFTASAGNIYSADQATGASYSGNVTNGTWRFRLTSLGWYVI